MNKLELAKNCPGELGKVFRAAARSAFLVRRCRSATIRIKRFPNYPESSGVDMSLNRKRGEFEKTVDHEARVAKFIGLVAAAEAKSNARRSRRMAVLERRAKGLTSHILHLLTILNSGEFTIRSDHACNRPGANPFGSRIATTDLNLYTDRYDADNEAVGVMLESPSYLSSYGHEYLALVLQVPIDIAKDVVYAIRDGRATVEVSLSVFEFKCIDTEDVVKRHAEAEAGAGRYAGTDYLSYLEDFTWSMEVEKIRVFGKSRECISNCVNPNFANNPGHAALFSPRMIRSYPA